MTERIKSLLERTFEKEQKKFRRDVDWKLLLALVVCAAVGWFMGGFGERGMGNGRARCPQRADDGGLGQAPLPGHPLRGRTSSGGYALPVDGNGQDARCPSKLSQPSRWSVSSEAGQSRCAPHSESPAIRRSSNSAWVHSESEFGCRILVGNARPNCGIIWPRRKLCL